MQISDLKFHNELVTKPLIGTAKYWELNKWYAVTFRMDNKPQKYLIFVPKFYITDFGSIPKWAWSILGCSPATGLHRRATIFHDWLFTMHPELGFKFANTLFNAIMKFDKTPTIKRSLIYSTVATAGWVSWYRWKDQKASFQYRYMHDKQFKRILNFKNFSDCKVIV